MITNFDRYGITDTFSDKCHVTSTVGERIVHQVAQDVLEPLPIPHDDGLGRIHGDRPVLELCTAPSAVGHPVQQLTKRDLLQAQAELLLIGCGEHQELLGEPAEPISLLTDRGHRSAKIIALRRPRLGKLDLSFDDRHGGTELVAGVGKKLSLLLQCLPLCGLS